MKKSLITLFASLSIVSIIAVSASAATQTPAVSVGGSPSQAINSNFVDDLNNPKALSQNSEVPQVEEVAGRALGQLGQVNDVLVGAKDGVAAKTKDKPTQFWNLDRSGGYTATIEGLRSLLYTNYYFQPSTAGEIYVSTDFTKDSGVGAGTYTIYCYDLSTGSSVTSWNGTAGSPSPAVKFYNLNTSHLYYFGFQDTASSGTISGTAYVTY